MSKPKCNYLKLIARFWQAVENGKCNHYDTWFYFRLLDICNRMNWANPFPLPTNKAIGLMEMDAKTIRRVRDNLAELGLIEFRKGNRNGDNPMYCIPVEIDGKWAFPWPSNYPPKEKVLGEVLREVLPPKNSPKKEVLGEVLREVLPPKNSPINNIYNKHNKHKNIVDSNESTSSKQVLKADASLPPVSKIVEFWNKAMDGTPVKSVIKIAPSAKRYGNVQARLKEYGADVVYATIEKASKSDFLKSHSAEWFNFDWFFLPSNFPKVMDGNYDNRDHQPSNPPNIKPQYANQQSQLSERRGTESTATSRKGFKGSF